MSENFDHLPRIKRRPVPANADLTGFDYMPLSCQQLKDSDTWSKACRTPFAGAACVNIWTYCWHQVPAGSIAADEDILIDRARVPDWEQVREIVLRGFVYCEEDDRLYHTVLCDKINEALENKKVKSRAGKRGATARWGGKRDLTPGKEKENDELTDASQTQCDRNGTDDAKGMAKNGKGREGKRRESISPPTPLTDEADATGGDGGAKDWFEVEGIPWLSTTGLSVQQARSNLNLWRQSHPPDAIRRVMERAMVSPKGDPSAWIGQVLNTEAANGYRDAKRSRKPATNDESDFLMIDQERETLRAHLWGWAEEGYWSKDYGPKPGAEGCTYPADLIAEMVGDEAKVQRLLKATEGDWKVETA